VKIEVGMKYKLLGKSGLRVSELCLGTMTFGQDWGWGSNFEESRKIFDLYREAGGNFIDTANLYTNGTSECYVGECIKEERERLVVATKYSLNSKNADVNTCGNHRKNMMQSVEGSLRRLKVDYIDLLWLHIWDYTTPIEEVMRAFDDLVRSQKVLYIGISDAPAWVVSSANTMAALRGWSQFIGLQIEYSLKERTPERELIPMAKAFDMTVTPWSPLGGGLLTGKYNQKGVSSASRLLVEGQSLDPREMKIAQAVVEVASRIEKTPSQVALKWIMQQDASMIPIFGARTEAQLKDNLGCLDVELSSEAMQTLDEASKITLGFPGDFFAEERVQKFCFGDTLQTIYEK
jgi:aryl-alcohol dehydrogenase-like predicted oxidoreductase